MDVITSYFSKWANGYGAIQHLSNTQVWVQKIIDDYLPTAVSKINALKLFVAADRICNAAMWLVVHQTYATRINLSGSPNDISQYLREWRKVYELATRATDDLSPEFIQAALAECSR